MPQLGVWTVRWTFSGQKTERTVSVGCSDRGLAIGASADLASVAISVGRYRGALFLVLTGVAWVSF